MSMHSQHLKPVPEETARVMRTAFRKKTLAMLLRDTLEELYEDEQFAAQCPIEPIKEQPAYASWQLIILTILQYADGLTDQKAANNIPVRLDWHYGLGLDLEDAASDLPSLSRFRQSLLHEGPGTMLLNRLLEVCQQQGWLKVRGKQRLDSAYILTKLGVLTDLEYILETLSATLDELATLAPDWLLAQIDSTWFDRYVPQFEHHHLPKPENQRIAWIQQIGADGLYLLQAIEKPGTPDNVKKAPAVHLLRQIWAQCYNQPDGKTL